MRVHHITPILNVTDIAASFEWFQKWGWEKAWDWGSPPDFGAVRSGDCDIFLCVDGQGGRRDEGGWLCIAVDNVDEVYQQCVAAGVDVAFPPRDMPWHFREMHVRHPDGHVLRVGTGIEDDD